MKTKSFKVLALLLLTTITFGNSLNRDGIKNSKANIDNVLNLIKEDIQNKKSYPDEKNEYDYSSKNYIAFLKGNKTMLESKSSTEEDYRNALINFYQNPNNSAQELNQKLDYTLDLIKTNQNYYQLLDNLVKNRVINVDEKSIVIEYLNYFFSESDYNNFVDITSIFTYHINKSQFSELEKRGMLTLFDAFTATKYLITNNKSDYKFLSLLNQNLSAVGKSKEIDCAGNMLVGMLGGSLGGPGGFAAGFVGGLWACYKDGCFD